MKKEMIIILSLILILSGCQYLTPSSTVPLSRKGFYECDSISLSDIQGGAYENQCFSRIENALKVSKRTFLSGRICQECFDGTRTECPEVTYDGTPESSRIITYEGEEIDLATWSCSNDYYAENNVRYIGINNYYGTIPYKEGDVYYLTEQPVEFGGTYAKAYFKCIDDNTWIYASTKEGLTCPPPSDCVNNEPTSLSGWNSILNEESNKNIIGECIFNQANNYISCNNFQIFQYLVSPKCDERIASEVSDGDWTFNKVNQYGALEYLGDENNLIFCSSDNNFLISHPLEPLEINNWYFQTFYTCPEICPQFSPQVPCEQREECKDNGCTKEIISESKIIDGCTYPATFECIPIKECTPNWQCPYWENVDCVNKLKTRICNDLNDCQEDKTEYISCEEEKTFIQQYGLYLLIAGIIGFIIYFLSQKK